jgi:membrane fusion protein (multidrug efflux system)
MTAALIAASGGIGLFRRHFFLIVAIVIVAVMGVAGAFKVLTKPATTAAGGPGAAPAGGRPGAPAGRPGGPGGPGGAGGRGAQVTVTSVTQRTFTDRLDVQGVAKGRQSVTLTATGGQVVDKVLFKSGDNVKKGQVLLQLVKGAEDAAIEQAQAQVNLAKSTVARWNKLAEQGLAPAATAEQYQAAYLTSVATLNAAKARLQDRVITAPFSGTVGLSDIAPGALISPGTAIVTLDDISVITIDIDVPDRNLSLIKEGVTLDATSDSYPGEHYSGRIAKIDTRIDERSRSFKARAELPNPGGRLRPGMLLHVGIDRGTHTGLAALESAVQYSAGQASVYLIAPRGGAAGAGAGAGGAGAPAAKGAALAGGAPATGGASGAAGAPGAGRPAGGGFIALQRPIVAGIDECGFVEIKDGLALGDRIVADGLNKLTPNQPVSIVGGGRDGRQGGPGGPGGPGAGGAGDSPKAGPSGAVGGRPGGDKGAGPGRGPAHGPGGPGTGGLAARGGVGTRPAASSGERCAAQPAGHAGPPGAPRNSGGGGDGDHRGSAIVALPPGGARGAGAARHSQGVDSK